MVLLFLFIALAAILFNGAEPFGGGLAKEYFCGIISKSVHLFSRSCLKPFSIYSPGGHFVQQSGTV